MKIAISNIAWPASVEQEVFRLLRVLGIDGIEIAPTRVWPDWSASPETAANYRNDLARSGFVCSSLQSIVFGMPELRLFGSEAERAALLAHIKRVADLAAALGARPMVFGAPKNRDRGALDPASAFGVAAEFFAEAGAYCAGRGVCLCIEPNPEVYGCNFISTSAEGAALVRAVASPGFGLHLDAAGMHLAGEDPARAIQEAADVLEHFHASEPWLESFRTTKVDHESIGTALRCIGWNKWISIEIRAAEFPVEAVRTAVQRVKESYGGA